MHIFKYNFPTSCTNGKRLLKISVALLWGELSLTAGDRQDSDRSEYFLQISLFSQLVTILEYDTLALPVGAFSKRWELSYGWCHLKLAPSWRTFCVPHTPFSVWTISPWNASAKQIVTRNVEIFSLIRKTHTHKKGYGCRCLSLPCGWVWLLPKKRQPSIEKPRL